MARSIVITCLVCNQPFTVDEYTFKARGAKYCSRECSNKRKGEDIALKFWSKVDRTGDCWTWSGYRDKDGYGVFTFGQKFRKRAHVFAMILTVGEIPSGMFVCHRCDNPPCCNPAHLFIGTPKDNVADMYAKGRAVVGNRILTPEQVVEIRSKHKPFIYTQKMLAAEYGVSLSAIEKIIARKQWRGVD